MKVVEASVLGFCGGVRNAVAKVCRLAEEDPARNVYVYGELAHNRYVMDHIRELGVKVIHSTDAVPEGDTVVLRAHGVPDMDRQEFLERGVVVEDATCPNVLRNQKAARTSTKSLLILGYEGHSEVRAIVGATTGQEYRIISSVEDLEGLDLKKEYDIIVQTTFDSMAFDSIISKLDEDNVSYNVCTRICLASSMRRTAVRALKDKGVECIVVIGDSKSANSKALFDEAKATGLPSFFVTGADDVDESLSRFASAGVSAGSSTPDVVIEEVVRRLEDL